MKTFNIIFFLLTFVAIIGCSANTEGDTTQSSNTIQLDTTNFGNAVKQVADCFIYQRDSILKTIAVDQLLNDTANLKLDVELYNDMCIYYEKWFITMIFCEGVKPIESDTNLFKSFEKGIALEKMVYNTDEIIKFRNSLLHSSIKTVLENE